VPIAVEGIYLTEVDEVAPDRPARWKRHRTQVLDLS
jgi:hypothetical protein